MNQEIGSIMKFIYNLNPVMIFYDNEMDEGMQIPCMICPQPEVIPSFDTVSSYKNTFALYIKIIEVDTETAILKSTNIVNEIMKNKVKVPLVDEATGEVTSKNLKLKEVNYSKIDIGTSQIKIVWQSSIPFTGVDYVKINQFYIDTLPKEG